jgi:hypothetical protein
MATCFWTMDEEKKRLVDGLHRDHPRRNFNSDGSIVNYNKDIKTLIYSRLLVSCLSIL